MNRIQVSLAVCALAIAMIASPAVSNAKPRAAALSNLAKKASELATQRANLDRAQFDRDALMTRLDYEADKIIDFVVEGISLQDYSGLLRGVEGTFHSRSGNTLDQSLLLATLLKDAGFEARIAAGKLKVDEYRTALLEEPPASRTPSSIFLQPVRKVGQGVRQGTPAEEPAAGTVLARIRGHIESLAADLEKEILGVRPKQTGASADPFVGVYWVEWRSGPASAWKRAHPAMEEALRSLEADRYFADDIPADLHQTISIQVFIEREWGGRSETKPITDAFKKPTALLSGDSASLVITLIPDTFLTGSPDDSIAKRVASASMFFPVIDGKPAPGGLGVTSAGDLVPPAEALSAMSGVFKTAADKLDLAATAIASGADKSEDSLRRLKRVWLEIGSSCPGRKDRTFIRDLAVWRGDKNQFISQVTREVTLTTQTGAVSPGFFVDLSFSVAASVYEVFAAAKSGDGSFELDQEAQRLLKDYEARRFFARSDMLFPVFGLGGAYRHEPAIVAQYRAVNHAGDVETGFDVIASPLRFPSDLGEKGPLFVRAGVLNAFIEHTLFGGRTVESESAAERLLAAAETGKWKRIVSAGDPSLRSLPEEIVEVAKRDLSDGSTLLFPARQTGNRVVVWWKANHETGELIAKLDNGWGGETVEDPSLRAWLIKLTATNAPIRVFGAAAGCTLLYGSARISQLLSISETAGPVAEYFSFDVNPCDYIANPLWQGACVAGVAAIALAAQTAEVLTEEAAYGTFMRACVLYFL